MLNNLTVSSKLKLMSVYILITFAIVITISLYKMNAATKQLPDLRTCITFVDAARNAEALFKELRISAIKAPMTIDDNELNSFNEAYQRNRENFNNVISVIHSGCKHDEDCLEIVDQMEKNLKNYDKAKEDVFRLTKEGNKRDAFLAIEEHLVPIGASIDNEVNKLIGFANKFTEDIVVDVKKSTNPLSLLIVAIIALLSIIIYMYLLGRSIISPIRTLAKDAHILSEGDLRTFVSLDSDDEIGTLANSFNQMVDYLRNIISAIRSNSNELNKNTQKMKETNMSVYDSNEKIFEKATSVSEACTEMAKTFTEIAQNCSEAFNNSSKAHQTVISSMDITREAVEEIKQHSSRTHENSVKIKAFGEKTKDIGFIINSIRDIAEQTNLLALNAAIEAARAGSNGRGFAVVADEVRSLASRTAESTKEITDMINTIQEMADSISEAMESHLEDIVKIEGRSHELEQSLHDINTTVDTVYQQLTHISAATHQQDITCSEIDSMIHVITDATRKTANTARDAQSSSELVDNISLMMSDNINKFKL